MNATRAAPDAPAPERSVRRPLLTVVVPVYNGGDEIVANVDVIRRTVAAGVEGDDLDLVVVSDGSIDGTAERLLATRGRGTRVIHYDRNLGKGYAVKAGALASRGDWIALVDADLDLDPGAIPGYLEVAQRESLDFAIGSKRHPESVVHYPWSRRFASRCYQALNRVLFRLDVRDTQVGLKLFRREVAEDVVPLLLVKRFAFDLELLAVASALGYRRIRELPVTLQYRFSGSQLRSRAVVRALLDTAAIFYRLRVLRTYQRKQRFLRGAFAAERRHEPSVLFIGEAGAGARLDYDRLDLEGLADVTLAGLDRSDAELVALLGPGEQPAGNWITAAAPFFADPSVAAVVVPSLAPVEARVTERAAAAILESRLGGASRRSRHFVGNVKVVTDHPAESVVIRRTDLLAAFRAKVDRAALIAWLAERGRSTVYTPETFTSAPPPALVRPHMKATYAYANARGAAARRTGGRSLSGSTLLSLAPAGLALVGLILLLVGHGAIRDAGLALVVVYVALVLASAALAAVRFRSLALALLVAPALVATQATYVAGFARGAVRGR